MKLSILTIFIITQVLVLISSVLKKNMKDPRALDKLERDSEPRKQCCIVPHARAKQVEKEIFNLLKTEKKNNRNFLEQINENEEDLVDVENDFEELKNRMKS